MAATTALDKIKVVLGGEPSVKQDNKQESQSLEEIGDCCPSTLTREQRLWGFASCFALGYLISFMSTFAVIGGARNAAKFGVLYSAGNIIALCGSGFLAGPARQCKLMMKPVRRVAAIIYLSLIFVVLGVAIAAPHLGFLILILAVIQFAAGIWYAASYIPFGRKILRSFCSKICNLQD